MYPLACCSIFVISVDDASFGQLTLSAILPQLDVYDGKAFAEGMVMSYNVYALYTKLYLSGWKVFL